MSPQQTLTIHIPTGAEHIQLTRGADGTVTARTADGRALTPAPPINPGPAPATALAHATGYIDPAAIHTRNGGPLSLIDSIQVLLQRHPPREDG